MSIKLKDTGRLPGKNIIDTNSKLPDYSGELENLMIDKIGEIDLEPWLEESGWVKKVTQRKLEKMLTHSQAKGLGYIKLDELEADKEKMLEVALAEVRENDDWSVDSIVEVIAEACPVKVKGEHERSN